MNIPIALYPRELLSQDSLAHLVDFHLPCCLDANPLEGKIKAPHPREKTAMDQHLISPGKSAPEHPDCQIIYLIHIWLNGQIGFQIRLFG